MQKYIFYCLKLKIGLLFFIGSILFLQGCCSTPLYKRRGKLSDAMEKASDEYKGERKVSKIDDYISNKNDYHRINKYKYLDNKEEEKNNITDVNGIIESDEGTMFSMTGGSGLIKGDDFYGLNHINLSFGGYFEEHHRGELFIGFGWTPIRETSELDKSLDEGVFLLNAGFAYKYFTTSRHTFLGQYFIFGLAFNHMFWRYKNPIIVEDGLSIRSDNLEGIEFFTGLGVHLAQTQYFQIGAEVLPGVIFWDMYTSKGFDNDVFGPFWMLKFKITLSLLSK